LIKGHRKEPEGLVPPIPYFEEKLKGKKKFAI